MAGLDTPKRVIGWSRRNWLIILGSLFIIFVIPTILTLFAGSFIVEEQAPDEQALAEEEEQAPDGQALAEVIVSALVGWPSFRTKEIISIRWGIWLSAFIVFGVPVIMTAFINWFIERNGKKTRMNIIKFIAARDKVIKAQIRKTLLTSPITSAYLTKDTSRELTHEIMNQIQENWETYLDDETREFLEGTKFPDDEEGD